MFTRIQDVTPGAVQSYTAKSALFTAGTADRGAFFDNTGSYTISFAAAATLGAGWSCWFRNVSGTQTLDPNGGELINGASTYALSNAGDVILVECTGSAFVISHTQRPATVAITGGTINGTTIGATSPTTAAFTTISATGVITSTLATGTAPFTIASTTVVANLNSALLNGTTWTAPGAIGGGTPSTGAFTTLTLSSSAAASATLAGGMVIGETTSRPYGAVAPALQISNTSAAGAAFGIVRHSAGGNAPRLIMGVSRGAAGTATTVQNGDVLFQFEAIGADGTNLATVGAQQIALVDGTPATGIVPTAWRWSTMNAAGSLNTRLSISAEGVITGTSTVDSTSLSLGSLILAGGVAVAKRLCLDGATGKTLRIVNGVANASVATVLGSVGPTGAQTTVQGWMRVDINGTDRYIPYW